MTLLICPCFAFSIFTSEMLSGVVPQAPMLSSCGIPKKTPAVNTYDLARLAMFGNVVIVMLRHYEASL